jgi:dynein heavy chain 1
MDIGKPLHVHPSVLAPNTQNEGSSFHGLVADVCIFIHTSIVKISDDVKTSSSLTIICPSQYLEFVTRFVKIYNEKRSQIEERQHHLVVGLEKLNETFETVKLLKSSLALTQIKLESKNNLANEKLKKMVTLFLCYRFMSNKLQRKID